jgi:hypothetical protein
MKNRHRRSGSSETPWRANPVASTAEPQERQLLLADVAAEQQR